MLGALLLVGSVMNIGNSVSDILKGGNEVDWREDLGFSIGQNRKFNNIMFYFSLVGVVLSFITIIISSLLIYGVSKENPKLMKTNGCIPSSGLCYKIAVYLLPQHQHWTSTPTQLVCQFPDVLWHDL